MIKLNNLDSSKKILVVPTHKATIYRACLGTFDELYTMTCHSADYRIVKENVEYFLRHARSSPTWKFYIVSSFTPTIDIAPMFSEAPLNCVLPERWGTHLGGLPSERKWWAG